MPDAADILFRRIRHVALNLLAHKRQRNTDGRDVRGVLCNAVTDAHALAQGRCNDRCGAAASDEIDQVRVQTVVIDEGLDDCLDLLHGTIHDLSADIVHRRCAGIRKRPPGLACSFYVSVCIVAFWHIAQDVCRAAERKRDLAAISTLHGHIVSLVVLARRDELELGRDDLVCIREHLIGKVSDMRRAGTDIEELSVLNPDHRAAGDAERADIERGQIQLVAADCRVLDHDLAILDGRDIGRRATCLEEDAVSDLLVHECACHPCRKAGEHRQNRPLPDLVNRHDAAVTAHDHERLLDAGALHGVLGHVCRLHHLRDEGGIDGSRAGTCRQAIELGDLIAARRDHAHVLSLLDHCLLVGRVVDRIGLGSDDDLAATFAQRRDGSLHRLIGKLRGIYELVLGLEILSRCQLDIADCRLGAGAAGASPLAHTDNADTCDISFEEGIGRLGRAVCDEDDIFRCDGTLVEHLADGIDDALCHTLLCMVGRRNLHLRDDLIGLVVDDDGVRECSADIDANADLSVSHSVYPPSFLVLIMRVRLEGGLWAAAPLSEDWDISASR